MQRRPKGKIKKQSHECISWALNQRTDNFLSAVGGRGAGSTALGSPHRGRVSLLGALAVSCVLRQRLVRVRAIPILFNTPPPKKKEKRSRDREKRETKAESLAKPSFPISFLPRGLCQTTPKMMSVPQSLTHFVHGLSLPKQAI